MPRFYCTAPLAPGAELNLPSGAARHVQVLRMQPGDTITLFGGTFSSLGDAAGEFDATITHMGRSDVGVRVGAHHPIERQPARNVHLAVGMPANERMDWLVEKAAELGVTSIQPLMTERSVLRLSGERSEKKVAHWHSVAVAACEQCGGNRVPTVFPVLTLSAWLLAQRSAPAGQRLLLSLQHGTVPLRQRLEQDVLLPVTVLSGPEGGLSPAEEATVLGGALAFSPVSLGPRVLRAETAALAALAFLLT